MIWLHPVIDMPMSLYKSNSLSMCDCSYAKPHGAWSLRHEQSFTSLPAKRRRRYSSQIVWHYLKKS